MSERKPITPDRKAALKKRLAKFNKGSGGRSECVTTDPELLRFYEFLERWQTSPEFRQQIRQRGPSGEIRHRKRDPEKARARAQRRREAIYHSNGN